MLAALLLSVANAAWAAPPPTPDGTVIKDFAILNYDAPVGVVSGEVTAVEVASTVVTVKVVHKRTPSSVDFLTYAAGAPSLSIGPTQCSSDGGLTFNALPNPVSAQGMKLDAGKPQPLGPAELYYPGDPVFVEVADGDQNRDPAVRETVLIEVAVTGTKQSVTLRLTETGADTGVFVGYVLTTATANASACTLALKPNQQLELHYTDVADPTDKSEARAAVAPYNIVFDATTGKPINGAEITLLNTASDKPAGIIGRDGVSAFPSTVTSGKSVADSSGADYSAAKGGYLLPEVKAGRYRLDVKPPNGYRFASSSSIKDLQQLPGAPYTLGPASFGKPFTLKKIGPVGYDIPLDPVSTSLYVQKTASAATASVGDMLQFIVTTENTSKTLAAEDVNVLDTLPQGFRYVKGSTRIGGKPAPDPHISADGQQLTFDIGDVAAKGTIQITYVTEVSAATPLGTVVNTAQASGAGNAQSNTATAQVQIQNELMQDVNTIVGRVVEGCGKVGSAPAKGIARVRILMENGAYAVTDKDGRYHFEAVKNGTHVVQLDKASLPKGYELESCEDNTRFAGRNYSQFVELHGGALWHADFHVHKLPPPNGQVTLRLSQQGDGTRVHNRIELNAVRVPVRNLSVTVLLPNTLHYVPGTATLDGKPLSDPEDMGGALIFRLDDRPADWHGQLDFDTNAAANVQANEFWITHALANFDTPSAAHQHTPVVETKLPVVPRYIHKHERFVIDHFGFARYDLGTEQRQEVDRLIAAITYARDVTLTITGYTDDVHVHPDAAFRNNQELSVDRARAIVAYLRQAIGMNWSRVKVIGRADQDPVGSNHTDAGRAENRRTVIDADFEVQGVPALDADVQSPLQKVATKGLAPADAANSDAATPVSEAPAQNDGDKGDSFKLDARWLQTASPAPEIIWPAKNWLPASPAIHVAVKHAPDTHVRLSVNGQPVSARNYIGDTRNKAKTVAVAEWLGVPLMEGNNQLVAEIVKGGNVVDRIEHSVHYSGSPVRAEIVPGKSVLIADGKTKPRIALRFYDRWGYPVRRGMIGRYTVEAPYTAYQSEQDLQKRQLLAIGPREPVYTVGDDGIATIVLTPTNTSGQVTLDIPLANNTQQQLNAWLKPGNREWVLVGIANGTAAFNGISGHMQALNGDNPDRDIYQDGRVAFYAKGMIKGEYLITAAYDSAKASGVTLNGLQQTVDPNQYFMLYGDASERGYDAQSASKLFLKIERGQFYAMFGDFTTGLTVTELARYDRQFNGVKSEYDGQNFKYNAFAAHNAQSYVHDEIQGNGTSGLYHLSHRHILLNSERITVETRDRYHSERVISSQPLSRYLDYTIDYESGAIFFKQPVPSRDENFNPVYIVAEYEVTRPGDQAITGGGRVAAKFAHNTIEVGATYVNEGTGDGANKLAGADLRVDFSPTTELKAEVAHTSTGANGPVSTLAGNGLPPGASVNASNANTSGTAYLATLQTHGEKLEGEVYLRQQDAGFGLGQQNLGQSGMRKLGADGRYRLDKSWSLEGELYRQQSLTQAGSQDVADAGFAYGDSGNSLIAGVRHVEDSYLLPIPAGEPAVSSGNAAAAVPASGETDQIYLGGSLGLFDKKLTLHGTTSQNVSGNDPAYPESTTLGADYKLSDAVTLFANEQFAAGNGQPSTRMTEMGVRSTPWERAQITSSVTQQMTEYGPRTFSTMGLTQGWQATKALTLTAGLNRVSTMHSPAVPVTSAATPPPVGTDSEDFTSLFFGGTYRQKLWSWTGRAETLRSASQRNYGLFSGFYRDLDNGDGFSASLQAFDSAYQNGGTSTSVDGRLGFAHRPDNSAWTVLEQLDFIYGNQQGQPGALFAQQGATGIAASQQSPAALAAAQGAAAVAGINQKTWKLVNNLQLNYRPDGRSQWSIYYGSKFARYHFDSGEYQGYTDLIGSEYRYDISSRWDVGLVASRLRTWRSNVFKNSFGIETGTDVATNMWLSIGYNFRGFYDQDFTAAHYTAKGVFIRFRLKFDQDTVREMADALF